MFSREQTGEGKNGRDNLGNYCHISGQRKQYRD